MPNNSQEFHLQRLRRALGVLYLFVLSLFVPTAAQAQSPVVAVWLPLQSGTLDTLGASGKTLDKGTAMAWEFAAGFRLMADSLNLEVVWIDEFSKSVFRINGQTVPGYPALAAALNRAGIRMVVGPMQSSSSEQLAQSWKGIVVNPVSRSTSVEAYANLWAATPRDQDEAYGMGFGLTELCST
jgi:outer membrane PBP1 activator LpoA protein